MSYSKRQQGDRHVSVITCSQTEAPQTPCVLRTAQIQPLTNTTLTQPLTIRPYSTAAAPALMLARVRGPPVLLLSRIHSLAQAMDRASALQQIRTGRAKVRHGKKGQSSQLQMRQHMLMQMAGRRTWHLLLSKLTSGKCCQTSWSIVFALYIYMYKYMYKYT